MQTLKIVKQATMTLPEKFGGVNHMVIGAP
jgi:hypothetical protein